MRASTYPLIDAAEAARVVLDHTHVLGVESVELAGCPGRVLAADIKAPMSLPADPVSATRVAPRRRTT